MISHPFTPAGTVSLAADNNSDRVALPNNDNQYTIVVTAETSDTAEIVFIKFGNSSVTAAVTDMPILPGSIQSFRIGPTLTHVAGITASGANTLYFTAGDGA